MSAADRIVRGRVIDVRPEEAASGAIYTVSTIEVLEDYTGFRDRLIEVRELGGEIGSRFLRVDGAAVYTPGSEVLVLLERGRGGQFRSMAMGMSKFDVLPDRDGDPLLLRNMAGIDVPGGRARVEHTLRLSRLRALTRRLRRVEPVRHVASAPLLSGSAAVTLLRFGNGLGVRWAEADSQVPVRWYRDASAPAPLTSGGDGSQEIQMALSAWTRPSEASLRLVYAGATDQDPYGPWPALGGAGVIFFEDPNDEIAGSVLAVGGGGGTAYDGGVVNGETFNRFTYGFVIFQNADALDPNYRDSLDFTRLVQHEIGHGIGLGHTATDGSISSPESNIMYPTCCGSSTPLPPSLGPDDVAGLVYIYPPVAVACAYHVTPTSAQLPAEGGSVTATVTTGSACEWSVTGVPGWLTVNGSSVRTGPGVVSLVASANALNQSRSAGLTIAGQPFAVVQSGRQHTSRQASDFNGDERLDLLWHHRTDGRIAVWTMNGPALVEGIAISTVADTGWRLAGTGDLDGDGQTDLVWHHARDGAVAAWLMNGMTVRRGETLSIPRVDDAAWRIRSVGDLDGDGRADVIWQHDRGAIAVWMMNGFQVLEATPLNPAQVPAGWRLAATADFNRDGRLDLLWQHDGDGRVAVWFMDGLNQLSGTATNPGVVSDLTWRIRGAGDLNGDGYPDMIWQNTADGRLAVWMMRGLDLLEATPLNPPVVADTNWHIVGPR